MSRPFRSDAHVRANERSASLGRGIHAERRYALNRGDRPRDHDCASRWHQRQCVLHREQRSLHVDAEVLVELRLGDLAKGRELAAARVGKQDVELAVLLRDRLKIRSRSAFDEVSPWIASTPWPMRCAASSSSAWRPSGDHDHCTFQGKSLRCGQADSTASAGDKDDFSRLFRGVNSVRGHVGSLCSFNYNDRQLIPRGRRHKAVCCGYFIHDCR